MGRPSALTSEVRELLERELADGVSPRIAAERVGVSTSSVYSWLADGRIERRRASVPRPVELAPVAELEAGLTLAEVAVLARHANARVTGQVYAGLSESGRAGIATKLLDAGIGR